MVSRQKQQYGKSPFKPGDTYFHLFIFFVFSLLSPICRSFSKVVAGFTNNPDPGMFAVAFFLCFCRVCTIYLMFYYTAKLSEKLKIPMGILTGLYFVFPYITLVLDFEDINSQRETAMRQSSSSLEVFQFHPLQLFKTSYEEIGREFHENDAFGLAKRQMESKFGYYMFFMSSIILLVGSTVVYCIVRYRQILCSLGFRLKCFEKYEKNNKDPIISQRRFRFILLTFSCVHICLLIIYQCLPIESASKINMIAPSSWVFWKSCFNPKLSSTKEKQALKFYRDNYQLDNDEVWLDQRENPVYPLVHGPKAVANAYLYKESTPGFDKEPDVTNAPNIVIGLIESMSASPYHMNNDLLQSNDEVFHGKMYDDNYLPNLNKLQDFGPSFSGLAAQGFPTYAGWFSIVSGSYQHDLGISLVMNEYNDLDDIPSFMRDQGYHTSYVSTSPLEFDVKNQYCFRGNKQLHGPSFLGKLPRWFDEVHYYNPTTSQYNILKNYDMDSTRPPLTRWSCDRLTQGQVRYHSQQYFTKTKDDADKKPLFELWTTVDMHGPFQGYDNKAEYDEFTFGKGLHGGYDNKQRGDRYTTLQKYTDAQIGKVIHYFQTKQDDETEEEFKRRKNTIYISVSDHGNRDNYAAQQSATFSKCTQGSYQSGQQCTDSQIYHFQDECRNSFSGNDEAVTVTGIISYFGDNETLKQMITNQANTVYTLPTDHQDLIYTIQKLVSQATGRPFVSSRQGRDLLKIIAQQQNGQLKKHLSFRNTGYSMERASETSLTRSHTYSSAGGFTITEARYPTCVEERKLEYNKLTRTDYKDLKKMLAFIQKIDMTNRMFNYQFRDFSCVNSGTCEFPTPNKIYFSPTVLIWYLAVPGVILILFLILAFGFSYCSNELNAKHNYAIYKFGWKEVTKIERKEVTQKEFIISHNCKQDDERSTISNEIEK